MDELKINKESIDGGVEMTLIKWGLVLVLAALALCFVHRPGLFAGMMEAVMESITNSDVHPAQP